MARKLLFVIFNYSGCSIMHAIWYAKDLTKRGHTVKIIFEGEATKAFTDEKLLPEILAANELGLVAGVCKAASRSMGCCPEKCTAEAGKNPDWVSPIHIECEKDKIPLLCDLNGHAGVGDFVDQGYEIVTF